MATDALTTVESLRQAVAAFVDVREWRPYHSAKNLSMSVAIEAAELMERFQWLTPEECEEAMQTPSGRAAAADELADVLIYCLSLANAFGLDVSTAVLAKLSANESRYPAAAFRGRSRRPDRMEGP